MSVTTTTIGDLCISPYNPRTNQEDANAIDALENSLVSRRQIYPLIVHPMGMKRGTKKGPRYGVMDGGRRLRAFARAIENGRLPADHPIDIIIRETSDEGELHDLALAATFIRRDLRDYEVYAAVAKAVERGRTLAEIAETNGQTITTVRKWARLGGLHKTVFAALEAGEISPDIASAFGATEDADLQLHVYEQFVAHPQRHWGNPAKLVRTLMKIGDRELEKTLRFVGEEAYRAEGGRYTLDLFADDAEQRGRIDDEGLLLRLADEKLEAIRTRARRQVGRDLRFEASPPTLMLGNYDQGVDNSLEIIAEPRPADAADGQWIAWLGHEMAYYEAQALAALDDEDLTDDIRALIGAAIDDVYEPLVAELALLQDRMTIDLPSGAIFATLAVQEDGGHELRFWWADRKAKQKAEAAARKLPDAPPPRAVSAGPIAKVETSSAASARASFALSGAAINNSPGYDDRSRADALIRDEHGLTAEGIQTMRSLRRETLRAAMLSDAAASGQQGLCVAFDYLLWSLLRDRVTAPGEFHTRADLRGLAGLSIRQELQTADVSAHVERTQAHRIWRDAVDRLKTHPSVTEKDFVTAFDAFRQESFAWKQDVAAIVAGCALERSAGAAGYEVELHDHVALLTGYHDPGRLRALVEPTEEMVALLPKARQLELVHPHVSNGEYLALEKLKAADLVGPATRALRKVADWVHPMLRFKPRLAAIMAREAESTAPSVPEIA